jgi:hypothetical protein
MKNTMSQPAKRVKGMPSRALEKPIWVTKPTMPDG